MKAQQAPGLGRAGETRQAEASAPVQTASIRKKRTSGGTAHAINATQSTVMMMLTGPPSSLARIQPNAPARVDGGGKGESRSWRRNVWSPAAPIVSALRNRGGPRIEIHQQRHDQADEQVDRHGDRDHL